MAKKVINAFNGGEVSPYVYARTDSKVYDKACIKMENFIPLEYGGAAKRPSTAYLAELGVKNVFIPFEVKGNVNYILSFSNKKLSILDVEGIEVNNFTTTILESELYEIHYVQSNDVMFLSHSNHEVFTVQHNAGNFSLQELDFKVPPLLDFDESGVTISSSTHEGETTLTASADYFNSGHVGGYFRFRQPRTFDSNTSNSTNGGDDGVYGKSTSSVAKTFSDAGVTDSINASFSNFTVETTGDWKGKVVLQKSIDFGSTFKDYVVIGDVTTKGTSTSPQKNFIFSSSEPEGSNSFLRIKYEASADKTLAVSIIINEPYFYSLCKVTEYTSATQVKAEIQNDFQFQYDIGEFATFDTSANYDAGDRVKATEAFAKTNYDDSSDVSLEFSTTNVEVGSNGTAFAALIATGTVANSSPSITETQIVDMCYGGGFIWILDRSVQVHKLSFRSSGKEFDYHGVAWNAQTQFPSISIPSGNLNSSRAYNDDHQTRMRAVSIDYNGRSDHSSYPIAILGGTEFSSKRRPTSGAGDSDSPVVDINAYTEFKVHFYDASGNVKTGSNSVYTKDLSDKGATSYRYWYVPIGISFGRFLTVDFLEVQAVNDYPNYWIQVKNITAQKNPTDEFSSSSQDSKTQSSSASNVADLREVSGISYRDQAYADSRSFIVVKNFTGTAANNYDVNDNYTASLFSDVITNTNASSFRDPKSSFDISSEMTSTTDVGGIYLVRGDTNNTARNDFLYVFRTDKEIFKYQLEGDNKYYRYIVDNDATQASLATLELAGKVIEEFPEMSDYQEGAFSDYRGHPESIAIYENRLCFGGSQTNPNTVFLSKLDDFNNFDIGSLDTDALKFKFNALKQNEIKWMCSGRELFIGTAENEWSLGSGNQSLPITPTQFNLKRRTSYGSSDIQALLINSAVLFLQRENKKIREWYLQENQEDYLAPNLALIAEHITGNGIKQIAIQSEPTTIIWMVREDGNLIGLTYERESETFAWHIHTFDSCLINSVTALPTKGSEDQVFLSASKHSTAAVRSDSTTEYINLDSATVISIGDSVSYDVIIDDVDASGTNHFILGSSSTNNAGFNVNESGNPNVRRNGVGDAVFDELTLVEGHPYNLQFTRLSDTEYTCTRTDLKTGEVSTQNASTTANVTHSIDRIFRGNSTASHATVANVKIKNLHYPMNEGTGTTITDINGSGNDGTFVGSLAWVTISDTPRWNEVTSYLLKFDAQNWGTTYNSEYSGLDLYKKYTNHSSQTVSGLEHLEGKSVTAKVNGVAETKTVSSGAITLASTPSNATVYVGLPYTSTLAPLYVDAEGSMGSKKSVQHATIRFQDTLEAKVGQKETSTDSVKFASSSSLNTEDAEVWLANHNEFLQTVYVVSDTPQPCTVLAMVVDVEGV